MKKAILILLITLNYSFTKEVVISDELETYVSEFIEDANKRNVSGFDIVFNVKEIILVNDISIFGTGEGTRALYDTLDSKIYIDSQVTNKRALQVLLYHELAHSTGLTDGCYKDNLIMTHNTSLEHTAELLKDNDVWNAELDKFFKLLK